MTEEQAKKTYERALKMEQEFGEYFTGTTHFTFKRLSIKFDFINKIHLSIIILFSIDF